MILDLSKLLNGTEYQVTVNDTIELDDLTVNGKKIHFVKPILVKGGIYKADDDIFINVDLEYEYVDKCDRCLKQFNKKGSSVLLGKIVEEAEEDYDEEEYVIHSQGTKLNITNDIIKTIVLSFPMKSLCDENCKGFCPNCGENLNEGQCNCEDHKLDPRLAKLKELFD